MEGVELGMLHSEASVSGTHAHEPGSSILLIGMRGTGKTFIGNLAAVSLSWKLVDADQYFEEKYNISVREFVHQQGWPAFRNAEIATLRELIEAKAQGHIISLGGGIVETSAARELLKEYAAKRGPVVHVIRPVKDIIAYLDIEGTRPAYGEPVADVFRRRESWFVECSNYLFDNQFGAETGVKSTFREVERFFGHISGQKPNLAENLEGGRRSYFLALTYPDVTQAFQHIEHLTEGVDALELRVDLLKSPKEYEVLEQSIPPLSYVQEQLTKLRRVSSLPIVFTVRTKSQGGAFPDSAHEEIFQLLKLALQLGSEYVDVEVSLPQKLMEGLKKKKGYSKIIASWHDWSGRLKWDSVVIKEKYELASRVGDIVKIVNKAESLKDNFALYEFIENVPNAKPIIAINMGVEGQMSRILNSTFSPVSHPLLPTKAAPGQLSFREIQQALHLLGLLPSRRFYLFGTPISQSMSPTLHNTAFDILGLPHKYELLETQTVGEEIKVAITSPDFGGASVTIPFKLDVIPLLDKLTPAAEAIGAVNTIVPQPTTAGSANRILVGDNTDWIGIKTCISAKLGNQRVGAALIIGAGGTARAAIYALHALDADVIYLYNRTTSKARDLTHAFPEARSKVITELGQWSGPKPNVIVSTVPASATAVLNDYDIAIGGVVHLTSSLFEYRDGPAVVVDMAYRPIETPLLALAKQAERNWSIVTGLEVLLEQGYEQFRTWTSRRCPRQKVSEKVWAKYHGTTV